MIKKIFLAIFILSNSICPQGVKFAVINNLYVGETDKIVIIDSLFKNISANSEISFTIFNGGITKGGNSDQYRILNNILSSFSKPYFAIPSNQDTRDAIGWNKFLEFFGDDKFISNGGNEVFIGINPTIPSRNLNFYSPENIEWLKQSLDTIELGRDIYFFSPIEFERIYGWQKMFELLSKKNIKLIINSSKNRFGQRNLLGVNVVDLPISSGINPFIFSITSTNIFITNEQERLSLIIDKTIATEKEPVELPKQVFNKIEIVTTINKTNLSYTEPLYWNGKIYTAIENGIISVYDSTGYFLWDYDTYGTITNKPIISDRILAIATLQGELTTLSAISGEQIQTIGFDDFITTDLVMIEYRGDKQLLIPKLTKSKSAIIFGTVSGKIYCYDLETLQQYWANSNLSCTIRSEIVTVENKILFNGSDGFLYCIDTRNGLLIWRWKEKAETNFADSPIITDGKNVFVISKDGTCYAIDLRLGKLSWKLDRAVTQFALSFASKSKQIILLDNDSKVLFISSETGKIVKEWKVELLNVDSTLQILENNGQLIVVNGNKIYRITNSNKTEILFTYDYAPLISNSQIDEKRFMVSDYNGSVRIFTLR